MPVLQNNALHQKMKDNNVDIIVIPGKKETENDNYQERFLLLQWLTIERQHTRIRLFLTLSRKIMLWFILLLSRTILMMIRELSLKIFQVLGVIVILLRLLLMITLR